MGIVLEAGEEVLRGTPFSFFEQLNEKLKHETGGAAIYMGVYRLDGPVEGGSARLRLIASTQSLPEGIQAMVNDARREGGTLRDKLQRSISSLDLGEIEEFDLFKTTLRTGHGQHGSRRRPTKPNLAVPDTTLRRPSERVGRGSTSSPASAPLPDADAEPDPGRRAFPSVRPLTKPVSAVPAPPPFEAETQTLPASSQEPSDSGETAEQVTAVNSDISTSSREPDGSHTDGAVPPPNRRDPKQELTSSVTIEASSELPSDSEEVTREFQIDSIMAPPPGAGLPIPEWSGTRYVPGTNEYNELDAHRQAEAASYQKLVATFLRTEFDSTKRRVARRLDAARRAEDPLSRDLAQTALERLGEEGQLSAFEAILQDASSVSL
jgi:hypothetical protein